MNHLVEVAPTLGARLGACDLCPMECGVNRNDGGRGRCGVGVLAPVCSFGPHHGEEEVLVGRGGSGTIFFSGCNLSCLFCQNHDISQSVVGEEFDPEALAALALRLERQGCENVNFVSPTHVVHVVAEAVDRARMGGLGVPVVFNCGGYESVDVLEILEGRVDIYMPDFKWADADAGERFSGAPDYPRVAEDALREMYGQVGPLQVADDGVARRGVLVRHLVMPGDLSSSQEVVRIVARAAPGAAINVMGQYRPAYRASRYPALRRGVGWARLRELRRTAADAGLRRVDGGQ